MDGSFISPPAKRQYHNLSTTMQELNNNPHPTSNGTTTSSKRRNNSNTNSNSRNPLTTPHGHTALRLLCHVSKIGGVIGKSGSVVKLFRQETGAKIRIEEPVNACDERIILVVAQENPKKIITLKGLNDEEDESGDEYEVSPAQEAFLRVFERILDVEAESEGIFPPPGGNVSCRMLAVTSQIGGVMGKGGKNIEKVRKESGAKIRVMPSDQRPACASSGDEVIQILGDVFAVKKALIAISRRLQDNPPTEKAQAAGSRPVGTLHGAFPEAYAELPHRSSLIQPTIGTLQGTFPEVYGELPHRSSLVQSTIGAVQGTFSEVYGELPHRSSLVQPTIGTVQGTFPEVYGELPHRSSLVQPTIGSSLDYPSRGDYTSRNRPLPTEVDRISALDAQRQQEIVFKLLCSNDSVGGVIGKGGAIVRALQDETGATISVGSSVSEADERVVTVSAKENPESRYSPAQNAVVRVFTRSVEVGIEKGQDASKGASVSARLLVPPNQVGCLMGKGGTIIQEMRKLTNTAIRIIGGDKVSKSNSENDQVVQIVGDLRNVQNAVFHVTGRLRDNLFPNKTMNGAGAGAGTGTGAGAGDLFILYHS
ncbi:hypothetical protein IFM89_022427 [Coptis chinensis]|uniref:K Homology domain-containing protein n=1 Tax=Coptis chinensis TaxID=261450 RepID=A0A835LW47_9MAGN|nr:hypothetical protein IFM89_022427 [Coptis chinensis]